MSRVFVVQMPSRYNKERDIFEPQYPSVRTAEVFGKLEYLLGPKAAPFNPKGIIEELHDKLKDYSDEDWLVLIGNPALIGFACAIAAHYNEGRINLLQWSGREGGYAPINAEGLT